MLTEGGWCDSDPDPRPFYRRLICAARGVNVKIPWLFAFVRHVEDGHYWAWKPRSTIFTRSWTLFNRCTGIWRRTRLAMPKTIYAPDSSSLKPGSGATEGVLDKGLSGLPDYILWSYYWTMKIQDRRLCPVSGWDSPWHGRQAWRFGCRSPSL